MFSTLTVVTTSPVPGWLPLLAAAVFGLAALGALLVFVVTAVFGVTAVAAVMKQGHLPNFLIKVRDAGHPVREHRHYHFKDPSHSLSGELIPLTESEAEDFGIDDEGFN